MFEIDCSKNVEIEKNDRNKFSMYNIIIDIRKSKTAIYIIG